MVKAKNILFVTGTDTGVGKTLLSAMLVFHLRKSGIHALAMKPFCSGGTSDVRLLRAAQDQELTAEEINPFYFEKPLAPLVAGRKEIPAKAAIAAISRVARRCDLLVVEGAGGLLVPLGKRYFVADIIAALNCDVVVAAKNQLGTINHTLLSCEALKLRGVNNNVSVVLMEQRRPDLSASSNAGVLRKFLVRMPVARFPYLGSRSDNIDAIARNYRRCKKVLATITRRP